MESVMNKWPEIEITSTNLRRHDREGKSPMFFQSAYFHRGDGVVLPVDLIAPRGRAYDPGRYPLSIRSFQPGRFGDVHLRIEFDQPVKSTGKAS